MKNNIQDHYGNIPQLINGEWIYNATDTLATVNPATGDELALYSHASIDNCSSAVEAADSAFNTWRSMCLRDRAKLLFDFRARLEQEFEPLCTLLTQDHGRTISESRGSVRRVIENVEAACSAAYGLVNQNQHIYDLADGIDQSLVWEPLGAFLIITPGNIPMHAWSSFVPYALAAGCSVVVSPSPHNPVAAQAINRIAQEVFPPGVVNMVFATPEQNQAMLRQPQIKGLGFIGSTQIAQQLSGICGELGKPCSLNGNGKNNVVILPDANVDEAASLLVSSCFAMGGQRCLGSDNVVIVGDHYDELKTKLIAKAQLKLGNGLDPKTQLGPMNTLAGKEKVLQWIEQAISEGASLVHDGRQPKGEGLDKGFFLAPSILENGDPAMATTQQEAFGPVAMLMRANDLDQAIDWINATDYGHSACIITNNPQQARYFTRSVEVGNVGVNLAIPQPYAFFPLGSRKQSFLGGAKSRMASMKLFMDEKTITSRWV